MAKLGQPFYRHQHGGQQTWEYSRSKDHRQRHILRYEAVFDVATGRLIETTEEETWDAGD